MTATRTAARGFVWLAAWLALASCGASSAAAADKDYEQQVQEGTRLHDAGDFKGAIAVYRKILKKHPDDARVLYEMSYSSLAAGDQKDAIEYAQKSQAASPAYAAECALMIGAAYDGMGQLKKGEEAFRSGLQAFPDNALLHFNLGVNL